MWPQPSKQQKAALQRLTSKTRLRPFRRTFDGHDQPALDLYVLDAHLASLMHGHLRQVEILLRAQVGGALSEAYGHEWVLVDTGTGFNPAGVGNTCQDMLANARTSVQREHMKQSPGNVVSRLPMSFWAKLLENPGDAKHSETVWAAGVDEVFNAQGLPHWTQRQAMRMCQRLQWARNRVNHCESVVFGFPQKGIRHDNKQLRLSPHLIVENCRQLAGRFDPMMEEWMRSVTEIDDLLNDASIHKARSMIDSRPGIITERDAPQHLWAI